MKKQRLLLLKEYHVPLVHLKQAKNRNRLVLAFGAGVSMSLNIPTWEQLVTNIANNPKISSNVLDNCKDMSITSRAQTLYEYYKNKRRKETNNQEIDSLINNEWKSLIREELYKHLKKNYQHPYIEEYIEIIKDAPITINYNFDDIIENEIQKKYPPKYEEEKHFETVWTPSLNFKRSSGVIYHPNGFISQDKFEDSANIVFTADAFQNQLIDCINGCYSPLLYILFRYTLLFIGLSLNDENLRHLLRQNAIINPGHFHYYVYYTGKNHLSKDKMRSIRDGYFETFNLITLFLDDEGLKELGILMNMSDEEFRDISINAKKNVCYNFYLTGMPGTGKTSVLNHFSSFNIFDEYVDPKPKDINRDDGKMGGDKKEIDQWFLEQFKKKNRRIEANHFRPCIQIIDRTPLDPLAYADDISEKIKAMNNVYKISNKEVDLQKGAIILLDANENVVYHRLNKRNPGQYGIKFSREKRRKFQELFKKYDNIIDTSNCTIEETVKKIAYRIYFKPYHEVDLEKFFACVKTKAQKHKLFLSR